MDDGAAGGLFLGLVIGIVIVIGVVFAVNITNGDWQVDLINRGYAIYCPDDGDFAYKGECDK